METPIDIRREPADGDVARTLIRELNEAIWERYPDMPSEDAEPYHRGNVLPPDTPFFVAYLGAEPVGCGAFRPMGDATVEIKRMYVRPGVRGRGVGRAILGHLEGTARRAGFVTARLETGVAQTEAIALYESDGYRHIPCWPPYDVGPISMCLEKPL